MSDQASVGTAASAAYRLGVQEGRSAAKGGAACGPRGEVGERYAATYRNGWEHAYVAERRRTDRAAEPRKRSTRGRSR